jgi:HNH endonuclease
MKITKDNAPLFWCQVDIGNADDCWEWLKTKGKNIYGSFHGESSNRLAYRLHNDLDEIPKGLIVCHSCDNKSCCNPKHLWLGTYRDNAIDFVKKNLIRHKKSKERCLLCHTWADWKDAEVRIGYEFAQCEYCQKRIFRKKSY